MSSWGQEARLTQESVLAGGILYKIYVHSLSPLSVCLFPPSLFPADDAVVRTTVEVEQGTCLVHERGI